MSHPIADFMAAKEVLVARHLVPSARAGVAHRTRHRNVRRASAGAEHNVHAVGVGYKVVEGRHTKDLCVRFYVIQKLPTSLIAPVFRLPKKVHGLPTDVIQRRPSVLFAKKANQAGAGAPVANSGTPPDDPSTLQGVNRPLFGGVDAANQDVMGGTLGYFCHSTKAGDDPNAVYLLSNSHVFGGFGTPQVDDQIRQPGVDMGGDSSDTVASFVRSAPIDFTPGAANAVDCAIAKLLPSIKFLPAIGGIGKLGGTAAPILNSTVQKCGMSSGLKSGIIRDISHSCTIPLGDGEPASSLSLSDQIYIEPAPGQSLFGEPGDSGSIIVDGSQQAVGLLCAGDPTNGQWVLANKISNVMQALAISLV